MGIEKTLVVCLTNNQKDS